MHDIPDLNQLRKVGDVEADEVVRLIRAICPDEELARMPQDIFKWQPGCEAARNERDQRVWTEIAAYLGKPYDLQGWDLARIERAQHAFQKHKHVVRAIMAVYSLPVLYIHPEIALTLMGTGRLLEHVRSRLDETQLFVDVVMSPRSLSDEKSPGRTWIRKVRLMHAIRRALSNSPVHLPHDPLEVLHRHVNWNLRPDDEPVDQVEVAYVMLTFSWVVVDGLAKLGYPMTPQESRDHIYAWGLIAHMIGVVDDLLPVAESREIQAAQALFERIRCGCLAAGGDEKTGRRAWDPSGTDDERQAGHEAGRQLMAALLVVALDVQNQTFPKDWRWIKRWHWIDDALQDLPRVLVRQLAGVPTARMLYLGRAPLLHWLICHAALLFVDLRKWRSRVEGGARQRQCRVGPLRAAARQHAAGNNTGAAAVHAVGVVESAESNAAAAQTGAGCPHHGTVIDGRPRAAQPTPLAASELSISRVRTTP